MTYPFPAAAPDLEADEAWKLRGRCRDTDDPDLWFPGPGRNDDGYDAQRICDHCPVQQACAEYATKHRIPYGIWGGIRQTERPGGIGYKPARTSR